MERTHFLNNPFSARFVRFHPIQWNEHIAMRVGVLGCPYKDACLPGYFRVNEDANCGNCFFSSKFIIYFNNWFI